MSNGKPTPGPWRFGGCVVWGGEGGLVADLTRSPSRPPGETEANARLIAAAPELLEACKSAYHLLQKLGGKNHDPEFSELQAAIAKAKGGE